jgi:hypothetical protein
MHPVIAEILTWKRGAPVKPVDQERWQHALREIDADLTRLEAETSRLRMNTVGVTPVSTTAPVVPL